MLSVLSRCAAFLATYIEEDRNACILLLAEIEVYK